MQHIPLTRFAGPLVFLGGVTAVACLASTWYINRLQKDLARAVRHDATGLEAANYLQIQLRHLRVHSLVFVADPTEERQTLVLADLRNVEEGLKVNRELAAGTDDADLAAQIERDYQQYRNNLHLEKLPPPGAEMAELARWSDGHHMAELLASCRELADRQRERMNDSLRRNQVQTAWVGRALLGLGIAGVLAGLLSGYATARTLNRQVAQLSVRVQAVRSQLDQNIGAMSVETPADIGELDEQLERVVQRVSEVCRQLQEQERSLLRAEQLAAVGQLAAGVAHEVRNPLTGVKLLLQAAVKPVDPTPLTEDRLHMLLQEVARIERTVQGLTDFAKLPAMDHKPQDLRDILRSAIEVAASRAEVKSVALRVELPAQPLIAAIDRDQMMSLLTNLLFNAIEASPGGSEVVAALAAAPGGMIHLTVADCGAGIDAAVAGKLFDPFTTTKPGGTGLGLSIAERIARGHGGTLAAANRPGGGACFTLTLRGEDGDAEAAHRG